LVKGRTIGIDATTLEAVENGMNVLLDGAVLGVAHDAHDLGVERTFAAGGQARADRGRFELEFLEEGDMYRQIDRMTGAKAVFIKSGVPGSVGSAACALWQELASQLTADRTFKVWPFEGELQELLQSTSVVVGEMYPRPMRRHCSTFLRRRGAHGRRDDRCGRSSRGDRDASGCHLGTFTSRRT
jgi:hypothetical protein